MQMWILKAFIFLKISYCLLSRIYCISQKYFLRNCETGFILFAAFVTIICYQNVGNFSSENLEIIRTPQGAT